jgi:hypothetical protein
MKPTAETRIVNSLLDAIDAKYQDHIGEGYEHFKIGYIASIMATMIKRSKINKKDMLERIKYLEIVKANLTV